MKLDYYRLARVFAIVSAIALVFVLVWAFRPIQDYIAAEKMRAEQPAPEDVHRRYNRPPAGDARPAPAEPEPFGISPAILISFVTLILSGAGTVSTVLLGWRSDRRQSDELRLRIRQLELQIADAEGRAKSTQRVAS